MNFGNNLKTLREQKNITQLELANILGVTTRTIQNYESGKREPNIETLEKLSNYFEVQIDYLIGRSTYKRFNSEIIKDDLLRILELIEDMDKDKSKLIRNTIDSLYLLINSYIENDNFEILTIIHDLIQNLWKIKITSKLECDYKTLESEIDLTVRPFGVIDSLIAEQNNLLTQYIEQIKKDN
ncbi:MAG: helix-turn-helix domain-containing protein [Clostridium celatum]|nr:helix-turn-helix domain-containing protein [Clostridium celatum]